MNNPHRIASSCFAALALACAPACQQSHRSHTRTSSESHFLACERDKDCAELGDGFECRSGGCEPMQEPREAAREPDEPADAPSAAGAPNTAGAAGAAAIDAGRTEPVEDPPSTPDPAAPATANPCGLDTPFESDEACLPVPSDGIQIHIGPDDYGNPTELERWVLEPGSEVSECVSFETPNENAIAYSDWHLSGRFGIQRALITIGSSADAVQPSGACANPNSPSEDPFLLEWPTQEARAQEAPENPNVAARASGQVHLHTFNFTDKPILRELWLNLYFAD